MDDAKSYRWTIKDKVIYGLVLIPFVVAFIGSLILMGRVSIAFPILVLVLYVLANFFQAGCCVGCPYRGSYCPALFGVYLANLFSTWFYKQRQFDEKTFYRNANRAASLLGVILIMTSVILVTLNWLWMVAYLLLAVLHFMLFLVFICPKCGYNETCPAGKYSCSMMRRFRKKTV